jgi:hypothetical protein
MPVAFFKTYLCINPSKFGSGPFPGHEMSLAQQYAGIGMMSIPVLWIAGAGSAIFWIIGKYLSFYLLSSISNGIKLIAGASVFVIFLHAGMYSLDDEIAPFDLVMEEV